MSENDHGFVTRLVTRLTAIPLRVRYLFAGLGLGLGWMGQIGPLWVRALVTSVVLLVVPVLLHFVRVRLIKGRLRADGRRGSLLRFTIAKAVLVVLVVSAAWSLQSVTSSVYLITGAGMAAIVAVLGPVLHPRMLTRPPVAEPEHAVAAIATQDG